MKKLLSTLIVLCAVGLAIVPMFTDCESQGRHLTVEGGKTVSMKCHWAGIAEIGVAVPLALAGLLSFRKQRKEDTQSLGLLGITGGAMAILFPTYLIGVCANPSMICNMVMRPTLILLGTLVIGASLGMLFSARQAAEMVTA